MIERVCYQLWERITTVWHGTEKPELARKKRQIQKAKGTGYFGHDEPMTRKRMSRINKKKPISSLLLSSSTFFLFLVCGFQGILLMMTPMTRNPRQHTTAGPAPFPSFFDAHFPLVILGIHERSIDRPTDRPIEMDACLLAVPLSLWLFRAFNLPQHPKNKTKSSNLARQSCFKSFACLLSPWLLLLFSTTIFLFLEHPHRGSIFDPTQIFVTSTFSCLLFSNPIQILSGVHTFAFLLSDRLAMLFKDQM